MLISTLNEALQPFSLELEETQQNQFEEYFNLLVQWNEKINLTAITEPREVAIKHFADSLSLLKYAKVKENAKIIDVGTGAGFPGVPLKIARPDLQLTLLDSLNKRLIFLQEVSNALNLNAKIIHSRAEDGGKNQELREQFDIATSRAVAKLNLLCEFCLSYVKVGGCFIAMKGPSVQEEVEQAMPAIKLLGGKLEKTEEFNLSDGSSRTIVVIKKAFHTPAKYPRHGSKIKSKPL